MPKPDMNPRTCIATREEKHPDELIRFVCGPDDMVVPDLKRKLPGRGVWVSLARSAVSEAVNKGLFSKGFKKNVVAADTLPDLVNQLLERQSLDYLSLAKKAGKAVTGYTKVDGLVRSGQVIAVVHSAEASDDGKGKVAQAIRVSEENVGVFSTIPGIRLDEILGTANVTHVALTRGGISNRFIIAADRLQQYGTN
jgi:predicted RNA-binding protein YlxR (DUF448 family)